MSKKLTLNADETAVTIEAATLLDPIMNMANSKITFTGLAKYTLPAITGALGVAVANKRHSGTYMNFGG
jgi:hypothetical protein